jgi:hypothetical protein
VALVNVTVYVVPVPETAEATHGEAGAAAPLVPAWVKSVVVRPVTDSEKTRLYVAEARVMAGELATANDVTVGTAASALGATTAASAATTATAQARRPRRRSGGRAARCAAPRVTGRLLTLSKLRR